MNYHVTAYYSFLDFLFALQMMGKGRLVPTKIAEEFGSRTETFIEEELSSECAKLLDWPDKLKILDYVVPWHRLALDNDCVAATEN
ncbi:hypothetical protein llap_9342 [Limosa lapponica baueri]|uniref:Uncharacterized protein n=1 Tax=Limosa lapponica baueri TaxID=1758121 RepID=A0A2I0U2Q2_LIMLA|nr:hypothetical protein llap_9342 [Limosa lapponica baueri]